MHINKIHDKNTTSSHWVDIKLAPHSVAGGKWNSHFSSQLKVTIYLLCSSVLQICSKLFLVIMFELKFKMKPFTILLVAWCDTRHNSGDDNPNISQSSPNMVIETNKNISDLTSPCVCPVSTKYLFQGQVMKMITGRRCQVLMILIMEVNEG